MKNPWLLPEGIEEILPPQAGQIDELCRKIIDLYKCWGYQLVMPPMIEYLESLLTGTGEDLDLQTFKITDQLSGRMMGIRADMTPQVARIDANILKRNSPVRLCYLGTVLHTRPEYHGGSRSPFQIGAELYGHRGKESDAEILCLMLETMKVAGISPVHVDVGHVGIYQGIVNQAGLNPQQESELFNILQRKAVSEMQQLIRVWKLPSRIVNMLEFLIEANGDTLILRNAIKKLDKASAAVKRSLQELRDVSALIQRRMPNVSLNFDLAELRGYHYHTGIVFATYVPGSGQGIAFGGRYDEIGKSFGSARPATGFSTDLKTLITLASIKKESKKGIYAPASGNPELLHQVEKLRQRGEIVVCELPGQKGSAADMDCDRKLVRKNGSWKVVKI